MKCQQYLPQVPGKISCFSGAWPYGAGFSQVWSLSYIVLICANIFGVVFEVFSLVLMSYTVFVGAIVVCGH